MEKLISIFNLCKEARAKGFITTVSYNGDFVDLYHHEADTYEIIAHITAYQRSFKGGITGLDAIEKYLEELVE